MVSKYRIAVIPGDGIGVEVMPEALRVLDAAAKRFDIALEYEHIDWASCADRPCSTLPTSSAAISAP